MNLFDNPEKYEVWYEPIEKLLLPSVITRLCDVIMEIEGQGFTIKAVSLDEIELKEDSMKPEERWSDKRFLKLGITNLYVPKEILHHGPD